MALTYKPLRVLLYEKLVVGWFDLKQYGREIPLLLMGMQNRIYENRVGKLALPPTNARLAIAALYPDENSLPFTLNLLRGLQEEGFYILLVSTKRVSGALADELLENSHYLIERFPIGRDFGSYKLGMTWLKKQGMYQKAEVLALLNDSMFYPVTTGSTIKDLLDESNGAPWMALFENFQYFYHAQSFFQLFRPAVFKSKTFLNFWKCYTPWSSRYHSIHNGEIGLTNALIKGGFGAYVLYNTRKLRADITAALKDPVKSAGRLFRYSLFLTMNQIPAKWRDVLPSPNFEDTLKLDPLDVVHKVSVMAENGNPTHTVGMICNHMYGAPLKRDLANMGTHTIAEMIDYAQGFTAEEMQAMYRDLHSRGVYSSYSGNCLILKRVGRI